MPQASKGLKITLGGLVGVASLIAFLTPYLELKSVAASNKDRIITLEKQQRSDHDLIIEMAADIKHIRREIDRK